jgi:hypothetical protein
MTTIRNRGTAGDVLNGTNTGLVKVEGPAVWVPGTSTDLLRGPTAVAFNKPTRIFFDYSLLDLFSGTLQPLVMSKSQANGLRQWDVLFVNSTTIQLRWFGSDANSINKTVNFFLPNVKRIDVTTRRTLEFELTYDGSGFITAATLSVDGETPFAAASGLPTTAAPNATTGSMDFFGRGNTNSPEMVGYRFEVDAFDGSTFVFDAATDISDPAATTITATSGQTVTVARSTSGPVTTLVPAGKTVLINPDPTESPGLRLDVEPSNEHFALAETDDFMLFWVGQIGNATGGYPQHVAVGGSSTSNVAITHQASSETTRMAVTGDGDAVIGTGADYIDTPATQVLVHAMWLDRETDLVTHRTYDADGLHSSSSASAAALTTTSGVYAVRAMYATNGSMSAWSFRKGVGIAAEYDDTTLAALASYLLTEDI